MLGIGRYLRTTLSSAMSSFSSSDSPDPSPHHDPSIPDVLEVKEILFKSKKLPLEIVDKILDSAEYWHHTSVATNNSFVAYGGHGYENKVIIRTYPLGYTPNQSHLDLPLREYSNPEFLSVTRDIEHDRSRVETKNILDEWTHRSLLLKHPCRKIVFTIRSRDQGWGDDRENHGTFKGSYTWFDVGLERFEAFSGAEETMEGLYQLEKPIKEGHPTNFYLKTIHPPPMEDAKDGHSVTLQHPFLPPATRLQSNLTAIRDPQEYVITWRSEDDVDPASKEGDELENQGQGRASKDGAFVRSLEIGDVVTVWARARFSGWSNQVSHVKVDVYWAI